MVLCIGVGGCCKVPVDLYGLVCGAREGNADGFSNEMHKGYGPRWQVHFLRSTSHEPQTHSEGYHWCSCHCTPHRCWYIRKGAHQSLQA